MNVDTLILGATYFAVGYASVQKDAWILEAGELPGADYSAVLRPIPPVSAPDKLWKQDVFARTQEFYAFLQKHKLVRDGRLDAGRMISAVSRFLQEEALHVTLDAQVIAIRASDGFDVTLHTRGGLRTVHARQLIDTTPERVSARAAARVQRKWLHLLCSRASCDMRGRWQQICPQAALTPGFAQGEWTVSVPFSADAALPDARLAAERLWQSAFPGNEVLLDAIGFDFDVEAVPDAGAGICPWIPPHAFRDPLEAFAAGEKQARAQHARMTGGDAHALL